MSAPWPELTHRELLALDAIRSASLLLTLLEFDDGDCEYANGDEYPRDEQVVREKLDAALTAFETPAD